MRPYSTSHRGRRGTITVIVVAFLALFFMLALTFVFYSIAESDNSKAYRDAATDMVDIGGGPDPYPIINDTLGQIIYGPEEGLAGAHSGLRGQDMSRTIYGYNSLDPTGATQPFNGYGRVPPSTIYQGILPSPLCDQMINFTWVPTMFNGMMFEIDNNNYRNPRLTPADPAYRVPADPAWNYRYYAKNANYTYPDLNNLFLAAIDPKTGKPLTMSYHRRDLLRDTGTGTEILPPNPATGPITGLPINGAPASTNPWINQVGRLYMLRPRPVDNQWPLNSGQSFFPYPTPNVDGSYGDVVNLEGKPGGIHYDSVWIDPDLPVAQWQGKNYKPLVAVLITDLDGRVNVNTAGNFFPLPDSMQPPPGPIPPQYGHSSGHGLGPWEVNPALVMGNNNNDAAHLSRPRLTWRQAGDPPGPPNWKTAYPAVHNRFGGNGYNAQGFFGKGAPERRFRVYPNENIFANQPSPGSGAHFYGPVDFDGFVANPAAQQYGQGQGHETHLVYGPQYQGTPGNGMDPPRPNIDSRYRNGTPVSLPSYADERTDHLSMYNPYWLSSQKQTNPAAAPDRVFGVQELRYLNEKFNFPPTEQFLASDLATLAKATLGNPDFAGQLNSRFAVTPLSTDIHAPGASPWLGAPIGGSYTYDPATSRYPTGGVQTLTPTHWSGVAPGGSADHDQHYRARLAAMGPVDLARKLTDYRMVANQPLSPTNVGYAARAVQDRQQLAQDIFIRLRFATTGQTDNTYATPGTPPYNALRWLAQLAVNIVDFTDPDDMMTPFHWNSSSGMVKDDWVYGFERPRLVMNETYVRYENFPGDMGAPSGDMNFPQNKKPSLPATGPAYSLRAWIELHNPITPANAAEQNLDPMGDDGTNGGYRAHLEQKPLQNPSDPASGIPQSAYRVLVYRVPVGPLAQDPMKMRDPDNVLGLPKFTAMPPQPTGWPKIVDFSDSSKVKSAPNGKTIQPNIGAQINGSSFFLLGSDHDAPSMQNDAEVPGEPMKKADLTHSELRMQIEQADVDMNNRPTWVPMFVLQRLANPYQVYAGPADPAQEPTDKYNPYITVDYLEPDLSGKSVYDRVSHRFDYQRGPDSPAPENMQPDLNKTFAWGRRQPHDARIDYNDSDPSTNNNKFTQGSGMAMMGRIGGHTFGSHNAKNGTWPGPAVGGNYSSTMESPGSQTNDTLQVPFLPLNHMDRVLISPAELLHVAAVKPHELPHSYFMAQTDIADPTKRRIAYTANWLDSPDTALTMGRSTFLFRVLDFLRTPSWIEGVPFGGRIPGKVNINTVFADITGGIAPGHFQAITDPTTSNRFTATEVNAAWNAFTGVTGRHPSAGQVTINDRPLQGLATAVSTSGTGGGNDSQDRTLARNGALWQNNSNDEAFQANVSPGAMQKYELMSKTLNQVTTRSNTFAVYVTVGYFEVMNTGPYDEINRPVLGAEIGSDTGNVVRHKFFAVIDRTNLTIEPPAGPGQPQKQGQAPAYLEYHPYAPLPQGPAYAFTPDPDLPSINPPVGQKAQVMVRVPATSYVPAKSAPGLIASVSGYYDGKVWTVMSDPGLPMIQSFAVLGTGLTQEVVLVKIPANVAPYNFDAITGTAHLILESTQGSGKFLYQHHRGEPLRLISPDPLQPGSTPGSPGPQPGFQYTAPRYSSVVKYVEQLK